MAKLILDDIVNLENFVSAAATINSNNTKIEAALEKTLSRDGTEPNEMETDLDMNSHRIINLPKANTATEPIRKREFDEVSGNLSAANDFDVRYLGPFSVAPSVDNDGNPLEVGALYFQTTGPNTGLRYWDGTIWTTVAAQAFPPTYDSSDILFSHPLITSPAVITSVQQLLERGLSIQMYSPTPVGSGQDVTTLLNSMFEDCAGNGYTAKLGSGNYQISGPVTYPAPNTSYIDMGWGGIVGDSPSSCRIFSTDATATITIQGVVSGGVGIGFEVGNFSMFRPALVQTGGALQLDNIAWSNFHDIAIYGYDNAIQATDVLSSKFTRITTRNNKRGATFTRSDFSNPNALHFDNWEFGQNKEYAAYIQSPANLKLTGCILEGNGVGSTGEFGIVGGLFITNPGLEGPSALTLDTCYFEFNKGESDLKIDSTTGRAAINILGSTFTRLTNTDYVENNIVFSIGGAAELRAGIRSSSFMRAGSYSASATRKYIKQTGAGLVKIVDDGSNLWWDDSEYIDLGAYGPNARMGHVNADGSYAFLPRTWSINKTGTGLYEIVHNFGAPNYTVTATCGDNNAYLVQRMVRGSNSFTVVTTNPAGTLVDAAFDFQCIGPN